MSDFGELVTVIHSAADKALLEDLLLAITTPKEREELVRRLEITKRLLKGEPQAKIAKDLGVGVATVTRGSKELAQGRFKILRQQ
jgi:TrpR family trp operon transcriptional repressor